MDNQENLRKHLIDQGRGMLRVKYLDTGELSTAAICPGCWNSPERRKTLIQKLKSLGVCPAHKRDFLTGDYDKTKSHSPGCPYGRS
ncbi:MAG: hypothetical protein OEZ36_04585 [Spirochaetota bacterium]|nr:hypothetical protein [Spirochaetota bacterium]